MRPSNILESKTPLSAYWTIQLLCIKDKTYSSLEPPLEYN